jgi:acetyl-CoA carboxylase biotin carboxyl carrier protein
MKLDDIREILDLVREHELAEFELERDGLKVRIRKAGQEASALTPLASPAPAAPAASSPSPAGAGETGDPAEPPLGVDLAVVTSPIVGTFYRCPEPGAPSFVEPGDTVRKGQVLCIIEAMKLMNEIESDHDGEVTAVYVDNGKPVQFGDRLFAIRLK